MWEERNEGKEKEECWVGRGGRVDRAGKEGGLGRRVERKRGGEAETHEEKRMRERERGRESEGRGEKAKKGRERGRRGGKGSVSQGEKNAKHQVIKSFTPSL